MTYGDPRYTEANNLTIETLQETITYIRSLPPVLCSLWFVDSHHAYWRCRRVVGFAPTIWAPQVFEWYSQHATPEEWDRAPAFCREPGIWARYSDGTDKKWSEIELAAFMNVFGGGDGKHERS